MSYSPIIIENKKTLLKNDIKTKMLTLNRKKSELKAIKAMNIGFSNSSI